MLTDEQRRFLEGHYPYTEAARQVAGRRMDEGTIDSAPHDWRDDSEHRAQFDRWCSEVERITVEMFPGGRAVLRHPDAGCSVELYWMLTDRKTKTYTVKSARIVADDALGLDHRIDLYPYFVAFALAGVDARFTTGVPRTRPGPGRTLDADFYRRLLRAYDALVRQGVRAPAHELARRMGEKHSTVKSWLHRGRKYTDEDRGR